MTHTQRTPDDIIRAIIAIFIAALIIWLSSCYSPRKALDKAYRKAPTEVAKFTREKFPCITVASDTVTQLVEVTTEADCPPSDTVVLLKTDSVPVEIYRTNTRTVRVPVRVQVPGRTITIRVEDSAKIYLLTAQRDEWIGKATKQQYRAETRGKWLLWVFILLLLSLGTNYLQFKRSK